jgi:hypothetical protein
MRQGQEITIACQSILIGTNWDLASIRVDPTGQRLPYFRPQGQMAFFYSNHHGSTVLKVESANVPSYRQPFSVGWAKSPENKVAYIDLLVTANEQMVYVHAINRSLDRDLPITLDFSNFSNLGASLTHHLFAKRQNLERDNGNQPIGEITSQVLPVQHWLLNVSLPKQSVSIFTISRAD